MPEAVSNNIASVVYPSNLWINQDDDFPHASFVSDTICLTSDVRGCRYQISYETSPEISEVEDAIPSTRVREGAKTLEGDVLLSYGWLSDNESVCNIILTWPPADSTDISARRIQLYATLEKDTEELPGTSELEGIANDACIKFCNSHRLISVLNSCLDQASLTFSNIKDLSADLDYYEDDESEDTGHIVIRVDVCADQKTALDEYDAWLDWFVENVDDKNRSLITLTNQRV